MELRIGETIASLRRERSLTQEQFAEVVGVSTPAVSKWETGQSYPDITLLPDIARFFGVSVDKLLSYEISDKESDIAKILKESDDIFGSNRAKEAISMLAGAVIRYPNSMELKLQLGKFKVLVGANAIGEQKTKILGEAIENLTKVAKSDLDRASIDKSYNLISQAYMFLGEYEKSLDSINKIRTRRDVDPETAVATILTKWGKHDEALNKIQDNIYLALETIDVNTSWVYWSEQDDPAEAIMYDELAIRIIKAFSNDEPCHLDRELSYRHEGIAWYYAKLGKLDETLKYLRIAAEYIIRFQSIPEKRIDDLPYFNTLGPGKLEWYRHKDSCKYMQRVLESDEERNEYGPIRQSSKYQEIIRMLQTASES